LNKKDFSQNTQDIVILTLSIEPEVNQDGYPVARLRPMAGDRILDLEQFNAYNNNTFKVKIIGIAGGSGSGKTTLAREIVKFFKSDYCTILSQDHYYRDQSAKF